MVSFGLAALQDRGLISVAGPERVAFLQGLVSNDVDRVSGSAAVWTALLTPQGKYTHDFLIIEDGERLLIDCEGGDRLMELGRTLHRFKLRSDVQLGIVQDRGVYQLMPDGAAGDAASPLPDNAPADTIIVADPRQAALGWRVVSGMPADALADALGAKPVPAAQYHARRIALGLPEGAADMEPGKAILLENGFDELGGVDWKKGCYMGQELTARTKYRGLVKKRLLPIRSADANHPLVTGAEVKSGDRTVGDVKSVAGDWALALLRLDAVRGDDPLTVDGMPVTVAKPDWLNLDQNAAKAG